MKNALIEENIATDKGDPQKTDCWNCVEPTSYLLLLYKNTHSGSPK